MLIKFFKKRKFRVVRFAEIEVNWSIAGKLPYSIIFFENDNGKRKYKVSGPDYSKDFQRTSYYAPCETWKYTGLFPEWSKDPLAEKLCQ